MPSSILTVEPKLLVLKVIMDSFCRLFVVVCQVYWEQMCGGMADAFDRFIVDIPGLAETAAF